MAKDFENITINGESVSPDLMQECADSALADFTLSPELLKKFRESVRQSAWFHSVFRLGDMPENKVLDSIWGDIIFGLTSFAIKLLSAKTKLSEGLRGTIKTVLEGESDYLDDDGEEEEEVEILYKRFDSYFSGKIPKNGDLVRTLKDLVLKKGLN